MKISTFNFCLYSGKADPPKEFDTDVLKMIQEFAKNKDREDRTRMPAL